MFSLVKVAMAMVSLHGHRNPKTVSKAKTPPNRDKEEGQSHKGRDRNTAQQHDPQVALVKRDRQSYLEDKALSWFY